jgi:RNA 2',3'-cyclic 3'-phosphodiesterase
VTEVDVRRLFLALWPGAALRNALADVQQRFSLDIGRAINADNLHITLVFLGSTPGERRVCLEEGLTGIKLPGFSFQLDQFGYWRKPQVLWAGSNNVPAALTTLVEVMTSIAVNCGCKLDPRPFHPHLTLFRKVRKPPREMPDMDPILWSADSYALVESITAASGVCYKVLKTWTLETGAPDSVTG